MADTSNSFQGNSVPDHHSALPFRWMYGFMSATDLEVCFQLKACCMPEWNRLRQRCMEAVTCHHTACNHDCNF